MPKKTGKKQDTRFKPGQSGNPLGRPRGARNRTTLAAQALLEGEAQKLTRKAVELAKEGNLVALRLCLERLLPPRRELPIIFALPRVEQTKDSRGLKCYPDGGH